jgi:hypothetical protein
MVDIEELQLLTPELGGVTTDAGEVALSVLSHCTGTDLSGDFDRE